MKLSQTLFRYRSLNHFTQRQLAQKLYVSRKTISNWENGRSEPSFELLKKLSDLYHVSTDQLLSKSEVSVQSSKVRMTFSLAWRNFFQNLFHLRGRISRKEYCYVTVPFTIIYYVIIFLSFLFGIHGTSTTNLTLIAISAFLEFGVSLLWGIIQYCLVARRNHDIGISAWAALLTLIPYFSGLYILILMFIPTNFLRSKD